LNTLQLGLEELELVTIHCQPILDGKLLIGQIFPVMVSHLNLKQALMVVHSLVGM
jgi:hypothetical protein